MTLYSMQVLLILGAWGIGSPGVTTTLGEI
ncbi:hypothetical protein LINGRAPRIM_LOCUS313 [Linum grandiflorum]